MCDETRSHEITEDNSEGVTRGDEYWRIIGGYDANKQ